MLGLAMENNYKSRVRGRFISSVFTTFATITFTGSHDDLW